MISDITYQPTCLVVRLGCVWTLLSWHVIISSDTIGHPSGPASKRVISVTGQAFGESQTYFHSLALLLILSLFYLLALTTCRSSISSAVTQRTRRTKAQIEEDLIASGVPATGPRAIPAAIKRSRLVAQKRARSISMATSNRNTRDSPPFDPVDYQTIVAYISDRKIRNAVFGGGSRTQVSGMPMAPNSILNSLAIKLNNSYNIRHNTTEMRLNGRVLHQRLKRYKAKYTKTKSFSSRTGSDLSAKNAADGIHTMEQLLESMCPCFDQMDMIFRDNPNVNPFGVLDTGLSPPASDDDLENDNDDDTQDLHRHSVDSDGSTTNGHDHQMVIVEPIDVPAAQIPSPGDDELRAIQDILDAQMPTVPRPLTPGVPQDLPSPNLNAHYRACLENDNNSLPPTPKLASPALSIAELPEKRCTATSAQPKKPAAKISKRKSSKVDTLTPEERALDSNSDDAAPVSGTQKRGASRATLASRLIDPLPSIDPSTVRGKEHKHPVAAAMQIGNAAKIDLLQAAYKWRQEFDAAKQQADLAARDSDLSWAKERFFLEREEERNRMAIAARNDRKAFCEKLVLEGKTPQELEAYLRLVYPEEVQGVKI